MTEMITVDFTAGELAKITQAAEACGMTLEAFALWAAVNRAEAVVTAGRP